jgi:hypothetical protein
MSIPYIPRRLVLALSLAIGFIFVNVQRSCISMAIILVHKQNHWTETHEGIFKVIIYYVICQFCFVLLLFSLFSQVGMVLSAFGWGYMFSQYFGVWMAQRVGAKVTLAFAVGMPGMLLVISCFIMFNILNYYDSCNFSFLIRMIFVLIPTCLSFDREVSCYFISLSQLQVSL